MKTENKNFVAKFLDSEVVSLELARKLRDVGFKQNESCLKFITTYTDFNDTDLDGEFISSYKPYTLDTLPENLKSEVSTTIIKMYREGFTGGGSHEYLLDEVSAPLASELFQALPASIYSKTNQGLYLEITKKAVGYTYLSTDSDYIFYITPEQPLQNALALLYIKLKEENRI